MKDYKEILLKYKFTDELGHPLENCQDYLDLLAETREAVNVEREACAGVAENEFADDGWHPAASNAGIGIASVIRSRQKPHND